MPQELVLMAWMNFLALLSPGVNFAMIVRNSLVVSRRSAVMLAVGIALAGFIHQIIVIVGLGVLICESTTAFQSVKIIGALYLGYIGLESLGLHTVLSGLYQRLTPINSNTKPRQALLNVLPNIRPAAFTESTTIEGWRQSLRQGFLTNLLNPTSVLFFLSMHSSCLNANTGLETRCLFTGVISTMDLFWHAATALVFSYPTLQHFFVDWRLWIERCTGIVLLFFAVMLLQS